LERSGDTEKTLTHALATLYNARIAATNADKTPTARAVRPLMAKALRIMLEENVLEDYVKTKDFVRREPPGSDPATYDHSHESLVNYKEAEAYNERGRSTQELLAPMLADTGIGLDATYPQMKSRMIERLKEIEQEVPMPQRGGHVATSAPAKQVQAPAGSVDPVRDRASAELQT